MTDAAAVRSLADVYRREQAFGACLDPDQAASTAVAHLRALGYDPPTQRHPGHDTLPDLRVVPVFPLPNPGSE